MRRLDGMLAVLHGPSPDDGVCMEIGYAAALGIPVVALTTDFQTYGLTADGPALDFPDPLLHSVLAKVIRVHRLARPPSGADGRLRVYLRRNLEPLRQAADGAVTALLAAQPALSGLTAQDARRVAYIEPSPHSPRGMWNDAAELLTTMGWHVRAAARFRSRADPLSAAAADWTAAQAASLAIIDQPDLKRRLAQR